MSISKENKYKIIKLLINWGQIVDSLRLILRIDQSVFKYYTEIYILKVKNKNMSFTYAPKKRKRKKTHGFLVRQKSKGGKRVLAKRRRKGRAKISV